MVDSAYTARNGMSLRDHFAAKALQGMLASPVDPDSRKAGEKWAELSYRLADAMVEARRG